MWERRCGLFQAFLASLLVSVSSLLVKLSSVPLGQAFFLSSTVIFLCAFPVALYSAEDLFPKGMRVRLIGYGALGAFTALSDYQATRLMPLGDEAVMAYSSIIFTVILARVFLAEPCTRIKVMCVFCIVAGVSLISSPETASTFLYPKYRVGVGLTVFGGLCDATSYIFIKELSEVHCSVILFTSGLATMAITGPMCLWEDWSVPQEPFILIAIMLVTFFHDLLFIFAVSMEEAGLVSLIQASDIVFSYAWELLFFEESYSLVRFFGAALVTFSVCLAAFSDAPVASEPKSAKGLPVYLDQSDSKLRFDAAMRADMCKWFHLRDR